MTADAWLILLAAGLVVVAGLLVSAETAIGRVSRSQIDDMRHADDPRTERLLDLIRDRPRYVNVLLFLSTIATVTATVAGRLRLPGPPGRRAGPVAVAGASAWRSPSW